MAKDGGKNSGRLTIQYFEGVNSQVQQTIALKTELSHAENVRAPIIGVLEKREGQSIIGTDSGENVFTTKGNYGLSYFEDGGTLNSGPIRVSSRNGVVSNIYYLNTSGVWTPINNNLALNLALSNCDFVNVDDSLIIVNGIDNNRMLSGEIGSGTVMVDSATDGSLFNSPIAKKVSFYKNRIYLADYFDSEGNELKTTVLRSSYPMGIVSLLDGDVTAVDDEGNWVFALTDTKYIYSDTGMNVYDIYRGNTKIATVTISSFDDSNMTATDANVVFEMGFLSFLSSDEVWIGGTFSGEKQYRWISNSSSTGRDVKQYDTFKLSGGDEDAITMMEPIGNILLIANKNSMMTWNDYSLENFDLGIGCCSQNGYIKNGELFFLHYTGIYSTGGGIPKLLSRKVDRYIKGATKAGLEAGAMGTKGFSVFCAIGDVTLYNNDGSQWKVLPDVCLEYAMADQNWFVHTNVSASAFKKYMNSAGEETLLINSFSPAKNPSLGAELISNGGFTDDTQSWEVGDGWQRSGEKMVIIN